MVQTLINLFYLLKIKFLSLLQENKGFDTVKVYWETNLKKQNRRFVKYFNKIVVINFFIEIL